MAGGRSAMGWPRTEGFGERRLVGAIACGTDYTSGDGDRYRWVTAMLAVMALESHGLTPGSGEVLVTGAAGGVGSVATAILAKLGVQIVASTGRPETHEYLKGLGATAVLDRSPFSEPSKRPLEAERWAGCIDSVGGNTLARVLAQTKYAGSV